MLTILLFIFSSPSFANGNLQDFLKSSAYGTIGGALAGVVSLALTDRPSDHGSNIAKGASLGLYAGIGYGLYQLNHEPEKVNTDPYASLSPQFVNGQVDGLQVLFNFAAF